LRITIEMETRANYILIGAFTIVAILGAFGFVYWFSNVGIGDRATYRVEFETPVSGLRTGSSVLFNGIRIGEVTALTLNPQAPRQVVAVIAVDKRAAVRSDTWVGLDYQGLTGNAAIALRGGSDTAPAPADDVLKANASGAADVTQAAREVLRKLDGFISDNDAALRTSLRNLEIFSQTLADNSQRIDRIIGGAETLIGTADTPGEFAEAARAIRAAADNLDKRTAGISSGLERFSSVGLREWERLAVDGRRTMGALERTIKNIDKNPSRLLFGGAPAAPEASANVNAKR
jgi:phospholipid/cholesterol/gamma-HCH transport system substrate-binding protein